MSGVFAQPDARLDRPRRGGKLRRRSGGDFGDDPIVAHTIAARIGDRTPSTAPAIQMATSWARCSGTSTAQPACVNACLRWSSPR